MTPMLPSEVRERIALEHTVLRDKLSELEGMVLQLRRGAIEWPQVARACNALYESMTAHLDLEDRVLVPTLREIDAWGPVRAEELSRHHRQQREELYAILVAQGGREQAAFPLAAMLTGLIEHLRTDMDHEDHDILSRELLRDDVIAICAEDG